MEWSGLYLLTIYVVNIIIIIIIYGGGDDAVTDGDCGRIDFGCAQQLQGKCELGIRKRRVGKG